MKPISLKGTRDFLPGEVLRREYLFGRIKEVFERYGYQPIETPAMEHLKTLTGKYGEEGDQLLFKILNNGDFLAKADRELLERADSDALVPQISKRGLRYDLTVPFARYVVMHQNEITFPFKRYQIQAVWRGDRPQKGRYQEFYQCDVDIVGSDSLMYEAELIHIYDDIFKSLNLKTRLLINHRQILAGMAAALSISDRFGPMTVAIDKWDKIGEKGVRKELAKLEIEDKKIDLLTGWLGTSSLEELETALANWEQAKKGLEDVRTVFSFVQHEQLECELVFDPKLARGLNYYTGCIFEVQSLEAEMGSLGGGGRYDELTAVFGLEGVSGVGVSLGAERIYDIMDQLGRWPEGIDQKVDVFFTSFEPSHLRYSFGQVQKLRAMGIVADLYPEPVKLGKQLKYASDRNYPWVVIVGEDEMKTGKLSLKNMRSGEQEKVSFEALVQRLKS